MSIPDLPPDYFARTDERDDALFYSVPRKVMHIDEAAVRTLTNAYADLLPHGGVFLDLMSSWRSHLPLETLLPTRVVGLGMNSAEMEDNPQLDEFLVHDLNQRPRLPFPDAHFDCNTSSNRLRCLRRCGGCCGRTAALSCPTPTAHFPAKPRPSGSTPTITSTSISFPIILRSQGGGGKSTPAFVIPKRGRNPMKTRSTLFGRKREGRERRPMSNEQRGCWSGEPMTNDQ